MAICNIVGRQRDRIHNTAYHTWSANKFEPELNETIGAIVTGFRGDGKSGQQEGQLEEGELTRGDYLSPVHRWLKPMKIPNWRIRKIEAFLKKIPFLRIYLARDVDCKSEDRVYPGIDYRLSGTVHTFEGVQYIRIDLANEDGNIRDQWNLHRIFSSIQNDDMSIQELRLEDGAWFGVDNFGKTSEPAIEIADEEGIRRWTGKVREGDTSWSQFKPWSDYFSQDRAKEIIDNNGRRGENICVGDLESRYPNITDIDLTDEDNFHKLISYGNLTTALNVTVYEATPTAIQKIQDSGGSVNIIPAGEKQFVIDKGLLPLLSRGTYVRMNRNQPIQLEDGQSFTFRMQDEDQNTKWQKSISATKEMLRHGILLVYHHRDILGRYCISVLMARPKPAVRERLIEGLRKKAKQKGRGPEAEIWQNWYLFAENNRTEFYNNSDDFATYAFEDCKPMLLAQAVRVARHEDRNENDWVITHWHPKESRKNDITVTDSKCRELMLGSHEGLPEVPMFPRGYHLQYEEDVERRERALRFFDTCIVGFYREWQEFASMTNTPKNIGFSFYTELLSLLHNGFRGSRTETGADAFEFTDDGLYESSGFDESSRIRYNIHEIKHATGQKGDNLGMADTPKKYSLGDKVEDALRNQSYTFAHIVEFKSSRDGRNEPQLRMKMLASDSAILAEIHRKFLHFHSRMDPIKLRRGGNHAEYRKDWQLNPPTDYDDDRISALNQDLIRFAEYVEGEDQTIDDVQPLEFPGSERCRCEYCCLGGAYWDENIPRSELGAALRVGSRELNEIIYADSEGLQARLSEASGWNSWVRQSLN